MKVRLALRSLSGERAVRCAVAVLGVVLVLLASACSSAPAERGSRGRVAGSPAAGGTGAVAGAAAIGSMPTSTSGPLLPTLVAPSGSTVTPPPPLAPAGDRKLVSQNDCPGNVSAAQLQELKRPDAPAAQSRWLYPYEGTVFPRGLPAPVLQWDMVTADAVYIRARSMLFEYEGCFTGSGLSSLPIPQTAWDKAAEQSLGAADPLSVELTFMTGGSSQRLPKLTLVFALATLKAAVYYNTYGSLLANQQGIVGGVVMRVIPGQPTPQVFLSSPSPTHCIGCHSVSADGSRMVAELHVQPGTIEDASAAFDLKSVGMQTNPPPLKDGLTRAGFSALFPDGSVYLTTGRIGQGPIGNLPGMPPGNVPGTFGPEKSRLFDTTTGAEIPNTGMIDYAYMPSFSVDGSMIAFNQMDTSGVAAGHSLAVMSYDKAGKKFSGVRTVWSDMAAYPAWPFFLPDVVQKTTEFEQRSGKRLVFQVGVTPDFATQEQPVGITPHPSDLWWLDVDSGKAAPLHRANGNDAQGKPYLPYGARDANKNYIPTVSPVAAGGYFWVFFTSKRNYGNLFVADPPELRAEGKKIWVAALDVNAPPGTDPSHPAFFLPGQELESGNIRAFAALEPCRENGNSCESGVDCCCGFCTEGKCACKTTCAKLDERCTTAADCCDPNHVCLGGFCGVVISPQ